MAFEHLRRSALDYQTCAYGTCRLPFRGPPAGLAEDYIAFIGGSETFGRFCAQPFPVEVSAAIGMTALNLGSPNAGLDVFREDPTVVELARRARVRVVQVFGAQNMSNRMYSVHPRRNDRFVRASRMLRALYGEVDFTEFHFTGHLLAALHRRDPQRFEVVAEELRIAWVHRMSAFLARIGGPTVLLWIAHRSPPDPAAALAQEPRLVDAEMLRQVCDRGAVLAQAVIPPTSAAEMAEMYFDDLEAVTAAGLPGPSGHKHIAAQVIEALEAQAGLQASPAPEPGRRML
ncbi:MAG: DUF6473 family protein [Pseudomonadota bacterium]